MPTTCCGTGCQNCVWISWAEEVVAYYQGSSEEALQCIDQIADPSLKAFIKLELSSLLQQKTT